jgi:signal transduction histidine kinase
MPQMLQTKRKLRTPLNGILGATQILIRDRTTTPKQRETIKIIHQSGEYLLTLLNDILDLSKIETDKMDLYPVDFNFIEFIESINVTFCHRAQQKGLSFIYQPLSHLPLGVCADEKRLRQIATHLLSNAIKFTEQGGIHFKVSYSNGKIQFQIEDTGIGIATDDLKKIFEPFQQLEVSSRHKAEGVGLGLTIVKKLVEMMNGQIQVKSTLGHGSIFCVELTLLEIEEKKSDLTYARQSEAMMVTPIEMTSENLPTGPPAEYVSTLLDLAMRGDIAGLLEILDKLEKEDTTYLPFINKVRQLARSFDEEQICELVQKYV